MKLRRKQVLAVFAITIATCCSGCTRTTTQTRLKSPIELLHNVAFGGSSLTTSEYIGSEHARDWDMAQHAEAMAQQQQQAAASNRPPAN